MIKITAQLEVLIPANKVETMAGKNICKYNLKRNEKVKTLSTKTFVKLNSKGGATFVSDLLFQRSVFGEWL